MSGIWHQVTHLIQPTSWVISCGSAPHPSVQDTRLQISWCNQKLNHWPKMAVVLMSSQRLCINKAPLWYGSERNFLPVKPLLVCSSLPKWVLKSSRRTTEAPDGSCPRCPQKTIRKLGYHCFQLLCLALLVIVSINDMRHFIWTVHLSLKSLSQQQNTTHTSSSAVFGMIIISFCCQ